MKGPAAIPRVRREGTRRRRTMREPSRDHVPGRTALQGVRGRLPGGRPLGLRGMLRAARARVRLRRDRRRGVPRDPSRPAPRRSGATRRCCRRTTEDRVDLGDGFTPLRRAHRLGAELGLPNLWIKDETRNPTHSFKDRVVSVALTKAREFGFGTVACASTGNLAHAVAAHAAAAGLDAVTFVPAGPRVGEARGDRRVRRDADRGGRHLRRREPPVRRGVRASTRGPS